MKTKKPSLFARIAPFASVTRNAESEWVARNIMTILARTGNEWRELSWEEYKAERLADDAKSNSTGSFSEREKSYFDKVIYYTTGPSRAREFSSAWDDIELRIYFDPHGFGTNYYPSTNLKGDVQWGSVKSAKEWAKKHGFDRLVVENHPKRTEKTYKFKY